MKKKTLKRLAVIMAASSVVALPVSVVLSQGSGQVNAAPHFTANQLANGLAFNQGPAVTYLSVFERPRVRVTGKLLAVERLVDVALRAHPSLALRFASDAQSGNPARVRAALDELGRLTRAAFGREFGPAGARRMTAWATATPQKVDITLADDPSAATTDPQPPMTVKPDPTLPPYPDFPTPSVPPPDPVTADPPTMPPAGPPITDAAAVSVPSGAALSLPCLIARLYGAARPDRKAVAETIAVVAFSLAD
jgi:hypothetical protein